MDYMDFIARKSTHAAPAGFEPKDLNPALFDWQADIVRWACERGRFGGFEDCGLGKSFQQLECARQIVEHTGRNVLILAPLAVASQTKREAAKFDIAVDVTVCKTQDDVRPGINVANYERLHAFEAGKFAGVIIDEGSIIKSVDGKIKTQLLSRFGDVPYRQTWTATPAPNDHMEIGNQSEFCGIMKRGEMLSMYFVHDGGDTSKWRLKGHATRPFWEWMASWSVMIRRPSDLGYNDDGYSLPGLQVTPHVVRADTTHAGRLFAVEARTLADRRQARKDTLHQRCERVAELANGLDSAWVVWCNLNAEGELLAKLIPDAVEVAGRHSTDEKEQRLQDFSEGRTRVLITKPKIGGFGLNWQHCHNTAIFPTDSWEQWYQMIRRFWRFGQQQTVNVHCVTAETESAVVSNLQRKELDAERMFDGIVDAMSALSTAAVHHAPRQKATHSPQHKQELPTWMQPASIK